MQAMRIKGNPPMPKCLFSGCPLVVRLLGCFALPFPYRVAVGAVCQIPGLALLGRELSTGRSW